MTPEAPTERYVVERDLGEGGFGRVVLATDSLLGRRVALKSLRGRDASALAGEARVLAALRHPNIVQVYDLVEIDGEPYLALHYIDGQPLSSLIEAGALSADEAVRYAVAIAGALAYAHRHGVVHNDVKPQNIIVGQDGEALLTDFGVASSSQAATLLPGEAGSIAGSLPYIAPEVIQGGAQGPQSDLYALAATLYEMLSGAPPFSGAGAAGMAQRLAGPPPRLDMREPQWRGLPGVLERALAPVAADRYADGDAFAAALAALPLAASREDQPAALIGPIVAAGGTGRARKPGAALGLALAMAGVALVGAAGLFINRDSERAGALNGTPGQLGLRAPSPIRTTPPATATAPPATATPQPTRPPTVAPIAPPRPSYIPGAARGASKDKGHDNDKDD